MAFAFESFLHRRGQTDPDQTLTLLEQREAMLSVRAPAAVRKRKAPASH